MPLAAGVALVATFFVWEGRTLSLMLPLSLLRARSFATGWSVYMLAYLALTGVMFYVTLLFQDVKGWSPLHTGLSWLWMNIPFILTAVSAGPLRRLLPSAVVVATGSLVGAAGVAILALLTDTTPFDAAFVGYVLVGSGWGALVPGVVSTAMRDVPVGVSGGASGILNAARQVGRPSDSRCSAPSEYMPPSARGAPAPQRSRRPPARRRLSPVAGSQTSRAPSAPDTGPTPSLPSSTATTWRCSSRSDARSRRR
jgi:hypothetical protein